MIKQNYMGIHKTISPNGFSLSPQEAADIAACTDSISEIAKKYRTHERIIRDIKECNKLKDEKPSLTLKTPFQTDIPFHKICIVIYLFTVISNSSNKLSMEEMEIITDLRKDELLGIIGRYNLGKLGDHTLSRPASNYDNIKTNYIKDEQ